MTPLNSIASQTGSGPIGAGPIKTPGEPDMGKQLEQLLWTEMLSHTGLEKTMAAGGAEGASEFFRFMIEAMARDFAEQHPLGLSEKIQAVSLDAAS
jgi:hypothetical protein